MLGPDVRVSRDRGRFFESDLGPVVLASLHPSAALRANDRAVQMDGFIADLRLVAERLAETGPGRR